MALIKNDFNEVFLFQNKVAKACFLLILSGFNLWRGV